MPVDIVEHFSCLPCEQILFPVVRGPYHRLRINLPSQQRGGLEYDAVRGLFLVKVANGRIQQCYYFVHPDLSLHCRGTVSVPEENGDRELQWTKAPSIGGLPRS